MPKTSTIHDALHSPPEEHAFRRLNKHRSKCPNDVASRVGDFDKHNSRTSRRGIGTRRKGIDTRARASSIGPGRDSTTSSTAPAWCRPSRDHATRPMRSSRRRLSRTDRSDPAPVNSRSSPVVYAARHPLRAPHRLATASKLASQTRTSSGRRSPVLQAHHAARNAHAGINTNPPTGFVASSGASRVPVRS
jgi:hypothetical protein